MQYSSFKNHFIVAYAAATYRAAPFPAVRWRVLGIRRYTRQPVIFGSTFSSRKRWKLHFEG